MTMTREEFDAKYGNVEVTFDSYYKFTFYFSGTTPEGVQISGHIGGSADDIYRSDIGARVPAERLEYVAVSINGQEVWRDDSRRGW